MLLKFSEREEKTENKTDCSNAKINLASSLPLDDDLQRTTWQVIIFDNRLYRLYRLYTFNHKRMPQEWGTGVTPLVIVIANLFLIFFETM